MAPWKVTTALALAGVMLAGSAFAQTPTGSPATGAETRSESRSRAGGMASTGDERVKAAQQALKDKGHDPGGVDGRMGPKTEQALRDFQKAQGMQATGQLDARTMQSLGVESDRTSGAGESTTGGSASPATGDDAKK